MRHKKALKLRTKLLLLILIMACLSLGLFQFLWNAQDLVWEVLRQRGPFSWNEEAFIQMLRSEAVKYDLPKSEDDYQSIEKLEPFLELRDYYTGMHIYSMKDGLYCTGGIPEVADDLIYRSLLDTGYSITRGKGETYQQYEIDFRNGSALVMVQSFHSARIVYPYFFFSIILSVFLFFLVILTFVNRKMKNVLLLKDEILLMASGELDHAVPSCGADEIGILSRELDQLRITLSENIRQEVQSRRANQDLITALSHDLRTPLTILNGYLEILKLKKNNVSQEEYLDRCLQKTADLKTMTDKMFSYALVYEEKEEITLHEISVDFLCQCLKENADFVGLAGFPTQISLSQNQGCFISGDESMIKRIFNNLFSNILKYADKQVPVKITASLENGHFLAMICNGIKPDQADIESNRIGLKAAEKMLSYHKGTLHLSETEKTYEVKLLLPLL